MKIAFTTKQIWIGILFTLVVIPSRSRTASALLASAPATVVAIKDYSGMAAGLFNNMRTPAALIGGAIVPLGILTAPSIEKDEPKSIQVFKKANCLLAIASLLSEILAITYSTVAINKLAEVQFAHTAGASELISKHFELAWIGTNVHFLAGLLGFGLLVASKGYFLYGNSFGKIAGCWSVAAFLQCISIVNKGIAMGSQSTTVDGIVTTTRFANNFFSLCIKYVTLIFCKARFCPLSSAAVGFAIYSLILTGQHILEYVQN